MLYFPTWKVVLILRGVRAGRDLHPAQSVLSRSTVDSWPSFVPQASRSASASICAAAPICCSRSNGARCAARAAQHARRQLRDALLDAKIGYTGLDVEGDTIAFTLRDAERDRARCAQRSSRSIPSSTSTIAADGAGTLKFNASRSQARQQPGGRPVDRDRAPPHRRDRHQGADDPAPGRRPHPGRAARRRQSRARQGAARASTAKMTFQLVDDERRAGGRAARPACRRATRCCRRRTRATPGGRDLSSCRSGVMVGGDTLTDAQPTFQNSNEPVVSFKFDSAGARRFGDATTRECRQALRHRARQQGDQRAGDPRADPRRQRHHLGQLHRADRRAIWRCCCAPARCRRRSRSSRSARSGPISAPIRSMPARSPASSASSSSSCS